MKIQAYFEEWSRLPGETVRMAISSPHPRLRAVLERITGGPGDPAAPRMPTAPLPEVLDREIQVGLQDTVVGSWAELPFEDVPGPLSLHLWFWATTPDLNRTQVIASMGGSARVSLELVAGRLELAGPTGRVRVLDSVPVREWLSAAITVDRETGVAVADVQQVSGILPVPGRWTATAAVGVPDAGGIRLATCDLTATGTPAQPYNGKIENPSVYAGLLTIDQAAALHADGEVTAGRLAAWDFSRDQATGWLRATGPNAHDGLLHNGGDRAVTGHRWSGRSDSFVEVPEEYAAVHFHDDDMVDADWSYQLEFTLPDDLSSGVYAVRLSNGDDVDRYPLFVRGTSSSTADVLFLLPTNTYLAYANDRLATLDFSLIMAHELVMPDDEKYLHAHPEFGRSCYDTHSDGSPVRYSSRRRPLVNVRPGYPNWLTASYRHFPADMYLLEWIERSGHSYQVATDEDLHREGRDLLRRYKTVVTGGHPEYWTWRSRDALETYLRSGGRLMYLGGNGFYWVTTHDPERPWLIEVRRDNSGTRCWNAPAGERTHVYTGEPGGIWRLRGKGPNTLVGVGFSTEGFSSARPFKRLPASYEGPAATWFAGIDGDLLGEKGHILGAAAGDEVDRFDPALGSPAHAHVLATADGFGIEYQLVIEDQNLALPAQGGPDRPDVVKADMIYFPIDGGGAVFSGSSIVYGGAMAWNDFDNDLAVVTTRVLDSFCGELPG